MTDDAADFRPEARAPKGFADRRARDIRAERTIVEAVSKVYERYGFEPLQTSALEYADTLGKFLPDAERPNAGVFALQDDDDQWMALRYDLTAPLARFCAQNWETLAKPFRRYAVGTVWRNEKPGPGRFREFVQCDADTVGSARPEADAEIIAMAVEGLAAAGLSLGQAVIKVNNRKLLDSILEGAEVSNAAQKLAVLRAVDKLDKFSLVDVERLLGKGRMDESGAFTKGAELSSDAISAVMSYVTMSASDSRTAFLDNLSDVVKTHGGEDAINEMAHIHAALNGMGVEEQSVRFDVSVVRGLEYYTGAVFEAELLVETGGERFGSIGGGGRYDDLVARFTGQVTPATGFSFGVSRLASALAAAGREVGAERGPVVILVLDQDAMADYFAVASELRNAGMAADSGMKPQMKYADRRMSPAAVIIGGDERANGTATVKDLDLGRALASGMTDNAAWREGRPGQQTVARADLMATVKAIVEAARK
jgi:histidyl-tRNA synthetase